MWIILYFWSNYCSELKSVQKNRLRKIFYLDFHYAGYSYAGSLLDLYIYFNRKFLRLNTILLWLSIILRIGLNKKIWTFYVSGYFGTAFKHKPHFKSLRNKLRCRRIRKIWHSNLLNKLLYWITKYKLVFPMPFSERRIQRNKIN